MKRIFLNLCMFAAVHLLSAQSFADMGIAMGSPSDWSYPTWPSHLDHLLLNKSCWEH